MKNIIKKLLKKTVFFYDNLIYSIFKNRLYFLFERDIVKSISKNSIIISPEITLNELENSLILNKSGIYLRFGDGDVFLLKKKNDKFQKHIDLLSEEMNECFSIRGGNVFKCLAIHSDCFGFTEGMSYGNHKNLDSFALSLFKDSFLYFVGSAIYSPVALHFIATTNTLRANQFLKILKSKTQVFIGNEETEKRVVELLFGKNTIHIKTPSRNAYSQIDRIESEALNVISEIDDFFVICVAMGCSGRPLMKRIWNKNNTIFLFDFGSLLDGISGNDSRTWLKMNDINYDLLLNGLDEIE
ncbi:MAG: GT-D fold domain-containing glycosyltransferase [Flavobacterium sp.]|uniref:GT-D fold domain-containing glycosyltransferase n=1 Tax=Flavobacterium sp. TaxID=239 RepID=UPI00263363BD|nr:GT-D fold domain-containing glycosyltransferase [Flavobacterium sp.]MDD5152036.1 GT-D fold domain-containing glycosyltransferase [Flavobacterium sp.]